MRIGIIGAGRVGLALGVALAHAGHVLVAASTASAVNRRRLVDLLPGTRVLPAEQVQPLAELVIVSVPDDALADLVSTLAQACAWSDGQLIAHTSGAHGIGVLAPAAAVGARPMALHPAMTFTGGPGDLDRLAAGVCFGVTVPQELRAIAAGLVADLGGRVEWVAEVARPLYHAALVHGANHLVTLVNESMDFLRDAGVGRPDLVLAALLGACLDNVLRDGDAALTGPVARGDAGTIARHVATLQEHAPDSLAAYLALARRSADRAIASGRLAATDAEPLLGVLAQPVVELPVRPPRPRRS